MTSQDQTSPTGQVREPWTVGASSSRRVPAVIGGDKDGRLPIPSSTGPYDEACNAEHHSVVHHFTTTASPPTTPSRNIIERQPTSADRQIGRDRHKLQMQVGYIGVGRRRLVNRGRLTRRSLWALLSDRCRLWADTRQRVGPDRRGSALVVDRKCHRDATKARAETSTT